MANLEDVQPVDLAKRPVVQVHIGVEDRSESALGSTPLLLGNRTKIEDGTIDRPNLPVDFGVEQIVGDIAP